MVQNFQILFNKFMYICIRRFQFYFVVFLFLLFGYTALQADEGNSAYRGAQR